MVKTYQFIILLCLATFCWHCTKNYAPDVTTTDYNYLIVEGTINEMPDSTLIKLSRSVKLPQATDTRPELYAIVTVEDELGKSVILKEKTKGSYSATSLNLDRTLNYRLRIKTVDNKVYLSDFVPVKIAAPIDSIGYTITNNGIDVYCNTHDQSNNSHYYRWDFQETWMFSPAYISSFVSNGTQIVPRTASQFVYRCWQSDNSAKIVLGQSTQLTQDVIYHGLITSIPSNSQKLAIRYSMLLKQYVLTKEAYQFWQNMRLNTENLGSIFDAQPSMLKGNIHNVADANEPVIGFVSVGSIQTKRVFIDKTNLPAQWVAVNPVDGCQIFAAFFKNPKSGENDVANTLIPLSSAYLPLLPITDPASGLLIGYTTTTRECADCTLHGTNQQPSFWK